MSAATFLLMLFGGWALLSAVVVVVLCMVGSRRNQQREESYVTRVDVEWSGGRSVVVRGKPAAFAGGGPGAKSSRAL